MARALIVGCGCHGRVLGRALIDAGWQVRGTTRSPARLAEIEADGIDAAVADPDRVGTLVDLIDDVAVIFWLLGSAAGEEEAVAALHGARLERMLEEIVDTPVRGFVYEGFGTMPSEVIAGALVALRDAGERWRIPFEVVDAVGGDVELWREGMLAAAAELVGG
jgi:nucleoside-diphosphate-sugar epimerase